MAEKRRRPSIPVETQARIFRRDLWICRWCGAPVVLAPALRLLGELVTKPGETGKVAYHHAHWSRHSAPLLDHLGAVVDHVEAWATGGAHEDSNFVTSCNKCNTRKNSMTSEEHLTRRPRHKIRGKYGEPVHWDGMAAVFLELASRGAALTESERRWVKALGGSLK